MLIIQDIHKSFGETLVLNGINISFENGNVYTLTGGNGSGKTTLFNIVSGFMKPTQGSILLNDYNISSISPYKINRLGVGRTFQDLRLAMQMTVKDNVLLAFKSKMFDIFSSEQFDKADMILKRFSLLDKTKSLAGEISYGQQKLLTLACLVANNANIMLIDEPVAGIDKHNFYKIMDLIKELKLEGKTIIQIEHHPEYIDQTSDYILKMEKGKIIC